MSMILRNGDYIPDGNGGFRGAFEADDLLERVLFRLTARRGACPLLPQFGSRLFRLPFERPAARATLAKQFVEEALADERELFIQDVIWQPDSGELHVHLAYRGETLSLRYRPAWDDLLKGGAYP